MLNCFWAGALFRPVRLRYPDEEGAEAAGSKEADVKPEEDLKTGTEKESDAEKEKPQSPPPTPDTGLEAQQKVASIADGLKVSPSIVQKSVNNDKFEATSNNSNDKQQAGNPTFKRSMSVPNEADEAAPPSGGPATIKVRKVSVRAKSAAASAAGGRQLKDVISSEGELHIVDTSIPKLAPVPEDEMTDGNSVVPEAKKPLVPHRYTKHVSPKRRIFSESVEVDAASATKSLGTLAMGASGGYRPRARTEIGSQRIIQIRPQAEERLTAVQMERVRDEVRLFSGTLVGMSTITSSHDVRWRGSRSTLDQRDPADPTRSRDRLFSSSSLFVSSQILAARKRASLEAAQVRAAQIARDGASTGDVSPTADATVTVEVEEEERLDFLDQVLESVKGFLRTTFDVSLLTSPTYILVLVSSFFSMLGTSCLVYLVIL